MIMKNRKIIFLALIFVLLISSIQNSSVRAQEEDVPSFGMAFSSSDFDLIDDAQAAGNHWVHYNGLLWSKYQPNNSTEFIVDLALESKMETASAAGMEMILTIRSTPAWARKYPTYSCGPMGPDYIDEFATFIGLVVKKYSQEPYNVKYYEIWNEPDEARIVPETAGYGCWGDPYDPEGYFGGGYYGEVLKAVYPAVKAANPNAQVVLGGLLLPCDPQEFPNWEYVVDPEDPDQNFLYCDMSKFFEGVLNSDQGEGWPYFDVVNFHGYAFYIYPGSTGIQLEKNDPFWQARGGQVEGKLDYIKELMKKYGVEDKPILLSEAALLYRDDLRSYETDQVEFERTKADYLVWLYTRNIARGIKSTTWFQLGIGWKNSGLFDNNDDPLEAYYAYKGLTEALDGARYVRDIRSNSGILGFEFTKGDQLIWVLFSEDGQQKPITLNEGNQVYNHLYDEITPTTEVGQFSFNRPIYIEFTNTPPIINFNYLPLIVK